MSDEVVSSREGGVVWIELLRPEVRNALRAVDIEAITAALREAEDDERTRVIVIGSKTPGMFCAGADLSPQEVGNVTNQTAGGASDTLFSTLANTSVPLIASIGGPAYGAGFAIAMSCDIRIASKDATFSIPAARLGIPYPVERMIQLVTVCGSAPARSILLLAKKLTGERAHQLGIVDSLAEPENLRAETNAIAEQLAGYDRAVTAYLKKGLQVADAAVPPAPSVEELNSMRRDILRNPGYKVQGLPPKR